MAAKVSEAYPERAYIRSSPVAHLRASTVFRLARVLRTGATTTHERDSWLDTQREVVG